MNKYYKLVYPNLRSRFVERKEAVQYMVGKIASPLDGWNSKLEMGPGGLYFCDENQLKRWLYDHVGYKEELTVLEVEPVVFSEKEPRIVFREEINKTYQLKAISATPLEKFMTKHLKWVEERPEWFVYLPEKLQTQEMFMKAFERTPYHPWESCIKNKDLAEICHVQRLDYKKEQERNGGFIYSRN